ncbi:isocitrate lyase/PEP mutase family protein [Xanthobacter tagetidis]|jgi:2-methylisocitrate lyase-like PEP mutase family enzyme|uniref:Isocitrate lyase/phosphoenolpyruvate mutase family protein n=1 Tax=Xanthobacter tagetidis TaxID=60216 RepID=A0A3L7AFA7_9HYPH|nr:isocitrate lyase/phosphoenolpyruvate mutase family protein [Xanthobacter tagetidis]MBB6308546.1 2-methylisocitrate lyase-like PEP mutase family enzyme [Xanthobacter tagetidis]RLP78684.1 isocitrate lyase/phosphoenolpyruvate mutase family protein [Xanthobacter tagetidis]
MTSTADKRRAFRKLHESGCFVLPNPWDIGTTRFLEAAGFAALATTSAGYAFSRGRPDGTVARDEMLAHIAELVAATRLPVNADFEAGYAADPAGVAESVALCVETGVAGLSIEDATGDAAAPLYPRDEAVARVRAARRAIDASGADVVLTARAECYLVGRPDIAEVIARLTAYIGAGADCVYAPGLRSRADISAVVEAVAPVPVNLLMPGALGFTVDDVAALGVRRISTGSTLSRVAWGAFRAAVEEMQAGSFAPFGAAMPFADANAFFRDDAARRAG